MKYDFGKAEGAAISRSREGAWIEIAIVEVGENELQKCRSREGAWIEMTLALSVIWPLLQVAPVRERGLKLGYTEAKNDGLCVAPVRERGLKYR